MTKKNNLVISFEGLPGSGKTTLINKLSDSYSVIEEIYLKENDFCNLKYEKSFYILNDISKITKGKQSFGICFIDRLFPSTLGYEYIKLMNRKENCYYITFQKILSYIDMNLVPDLYIFIETDIDKSIKRKECINKNNIWGNKNDLELMNKFYNYYFEFLESNTDVIKISNNQSIQAIYNKILMIVGEKHGEI
jgi:thymidylate kinase